jgi:hypothetical protein
MCSLVEGLNERAADGVDKATVICYQELGRYLPQSCPGVFYRSRRKGGRDYGLLLAYVQVAWYQLVEYLCIRRICFSKSDSWENP